MTYFLTTTTLVAVSFFLGAALSYPLYRHLRRLERVPPIAKWEEVVKEIEEEVKYSTKDGRKTWRRIKIE